jgi:hypothetical protein
MPEFLFPGVYLAEVAFHATPIDGVATSTDNSVADSVSVETSQVRASGAPAPAWTDDNQHDPGITTLTLLAYALDALAFRAAPASEPAQRRTIVDRDWP